MFPAFGKTGEGRKALADAGRAGAKYAFADDYVVSNQVSIRPYTSGSLIGAVNEKLGLVNAWTVIAPAQLGAGLVTAAIGTPYFLHLLMRGRREA